MILMTNLQCMRDFNPKVAVDRRGTFCFKCPLLHLLTLSAVFHTFLKIKTLNSNANELISLPVRQFSIKSIYFYKVQLKAIFILFVFHPKFHLLDLFFSNRSCCEWRPCAKKFGADCICFFLQHFLSFNLIMMFGFHGVAQLICFCGE